MSIKKTSEFKKSDFEYESPDGDTICITFVDTTDRQYVEIKKKDSDDKRTYDFDALCEIVDECRKLYHTIPSAPVARLVQPEITDHRSSRELSPSDIQQNVASSMGNYDDQVIPLESLNETNAVVVSTDKDESWKKEAETRKSNPAPLIDETKKIKKKDKKLIGPKAADML